MEGTMVRIEDIIQKREITQHVVINVSKLVMMQTDRPLRSLINACELINADGMGIVWGCRLLGYKIPERVSPQPLPEPLLRSIPRFCEP